MVARQYHLNIADMKKLLLIIAIITFGNQLFAQVNTTWAFTTYAFAVGTPDGVTIRWDALSDQTEIEGCYLYKKVTHNHPYELLDSEMLVSPDGMYSFTDNGTFDPLYPPIYSIHIQTVDSTYIVDKIFGFKDFSFEEVGDKKFEMRLTAWNTNQCCRMVKVWLDGIFVADTGYDSTFSFTFDLTHFSGPPYEIKIYLIFEDNSMYFGYAEFEITGTDLFYIYNLLGVSDLEANNGIFSIYPNPATTEVRLQLPENIQPSSAVVEVFSISGQKLMGFTPDTQTVIMETGKLSAGMYLVRIYDGQRWHWQKLVVTR